MEWVIDASSACGGSNPNDCILQDSGNLLQCLQRSLQLVTCHCSQDQISVSNLSMRHWSILLRNLIGLKSPTLILSPLSLRLSASASSDCA